MEHKVREIFSTQTVGHPKPSRVLLCQEEWSSVFLYSLAFLPRITLIQAWKDTVKRVLGEDFSVSQNDMYSETNHKSNWELINVHGICRFLWCPITRFYALCLKVNSIVDDLYPVKLQVLALVCTMVDWFDLLFIPTVVSKAVLPYWSIHKIQKQACKCTHMIKTQEATLSPQ